MRRFFLLFLLPLLSLAQNAILPPELHKPFLDVNGKPLGGGYILTCVAGMLCTGNAPTYAPANPLATFQDVGATVQNTNPVRLDFSGWAQIRLTNAAYKIVALDKNGVQQWSLDNVSASFPPSSIVEVTGDFLVPGKLTTGQGPLIDVTAPAYGAKGDNITADDGHFASAVTFAEAGGGTLYFPCGTYLLTGAGLVIHKPNVSIMAQNQNCVVFHHTGTGTGVTIQMVPFTVTPAGEYSGFTVWGTSNGTNGILSGSIVASHFHDIAVGGYTGVGAAGMRLYNKSHPGMPDNTWTERNLFQNMTLGGLPNLTGGFFNTNSLVLDGDDIADSFGYNRFEDIKVNVSTGMLGFVLKTGFFYNSTLTQTCNMDNTITGSVGGVCIQSNGNWDSNTITINGEFQNPGPGTGTPFSVQIKPGAKFNNTHGSAVSVFAPGGAQMAVDNQNGATAGPSTASLVESGPHFNWDTGTFNVTPGTNPAIPDPIIRSAYSSIGLLNGAGVEMPYVAMFEATPNKFIVGSVPFGQPISGMNERFWVNTFGDAWVSRNLQVHSCNFLALGNVAADLGGCASAQSSGYRSLFMNATVGINEQVGFGDSNWEAGFGSVINTNVAHPIIWAYDADTTDFELFEKGFQTPVTSTNKSFGIRHGGGIQQQKGDIMGSCSLSAGSCTWSFPGGAWPTTPTCVGSPADSAATSTGWWITPSTTGCTVNNAGTSGSFTFVAMGKS